MWKIKISDRKKVVGLIESGNWARYETVRGKGSAASCIICGRKPSIVEKGYYDGTRVFTICCPHCCNKHFRDPDETGIDISVCARKIYASIRDWNKVNRNVDALVAQAYSDGWNSGYQHAMDDQGLE